MIPLPNPNLTKLPWFVAMLVSLFLLTGATWYYTPAPQSMLVTPPTPTPKNPAPIKPPTGWVDSQGSPHAPVTAATTFAPFLNIVPDEDGTALFISAGSTEVGGTVVADVSIVGGGAHKGGTMTYSSTVQAYVTTIDPPGLTAGSNKEGSILITTTLGLDTGLAEFNRAYVPDLANNDPPEIILSQDGLLELTVSPGTFSSDAYVAVVPSYGLPGPLPVGHRLAGSAYSVRASGAIVEAEKQMLLLLYYNPITLAGADPHTLAIFAWDASPPNPHWVNLGGNFFNTPQGDALLVPTSRFTTYALMVTSAWRDDFDDLTGLSQNSNVVQENSGLRLSGSALSGMAISLPITPTTANAIWGSLTFTYTATPPTTTLTVDVLSLNNSVILSNVSSGISLANLDPAQYPALKLRANLNSTALGQTPRLDSWKLTWQPIEKIYLPVVMK